MIYDKYIEKIEKVKEILAKIRRYRFLILAILTAIVMAVTGLLIANGAVYGDAECPATITYGTKLEYRAKAFMQKTYFEFSSIYEDEWTTTQPQKPGEYKVRAVAKGTFGVKHYGEDHYFVIKAKEVTVTIKETEIEYGNEPTVTGELSYEDTVSCDAFEYLEIKGKTAKLKPKAKNIKIENAAGEDVTDYYSITVKEADITYIPRTLTFSVPDATHIYDGKEFLYEEYELVSGSLAYEDVMDVKFIETVYLAGEKVQNIPQVTVKNAEGLDVTNFYEVAGEFGYISVEKRPLLIQRDSKSKEYDGVVLTYPESIIDSTTTLVDGHKKVDGAAAAITDVGSIKNTIEITVLDADNNDVTSNYAITFPDDAILEITPRPLAVTSKGISETYDAEALTLNEYTIDEGYSLVDTEKETASFTGSITDVGTTKNEFILTIKKADGTDSTGNYAISYTYGDLTVNPRPICIITHDCQWVYDGVEHADGDGLGDTYEYTATDLNIDEKQLTLLTEFGHTLEIDKTPEKYTSKVTNVKDSGEYNKLVFIVKDKSGVDISRNYLLSYQYGTLTILSRTIKVVTHDCEWVYDGKTHHDGDGLGDTHAYSGDDLIVDESQYYSLVAGDSLQFVKSTAFVTNKADSGLINKLQLTVVNDVNPDVAENYSIEYEDQGKLTILPRPVYFTSHTHKWTYDGQFHGETIDCDKGGYTSADLTIGIVNGVEYYDIVEGHKFQITNAIEVRFVKDTVAALDGNILPNTVRLTVVDENDETVDYSDNYTIVRNHEAIGTLEIVKVALTIQSGSAEKTYDGSALTYENHAITQGALVGAEQITATYTGSQLNAYTTPESENGQSKNYFTVVIKGDYPKSYFDETIDTFDTTDNYDITYDEGTLTVYKRPLAFTSESKSEMYDAEPLTWEKYTIDDGYELVDGEKETAYFTGTITDVGKAENAFTVTVEKANGEDSTYNYTYTYTKGILEVTPRPIKIDRRDYTWVYDGKMHHDGENWDTNAYTNNDLVINQEYYSVLEDKGHALQVAKIYNKVKYVSDSGTENDAEFTVVDKNGKDLGGNYSISYTKNGKLSIVPRTIKVVTHDCEWVYDGESHHDGDGLGDTHAYVGEDLFIKDGVYYSLVDGDNLKIVKALSFVSDVHNDGIANILELTVVNGDNPNLADNYIIEYDYSGILTIIPRPIYITTHTHEWTYDGQFHGEAIDCDKNGYSEADLSIGILNGKTFYSIVGGQKLKLVQSDVIRFVAENAKCNQATFEIISKEDETLDFTENYEIVTQLGTLTIKPVSIQMTSATETKMYDGEKLFIWKSEVTGGALVDGEKMETVVYTGEITSVGEADNTFMVEKISAKYPSEYGKDDLVDFNTVSNYDIEYVYGKLTVTKRPIYLIYHDHSKIYDGTELSCAQCKYGESDLKIEKDTYYDLVEGQYLSVDPNKVSKVLDTWDNKDENNNFEMQIVDEDGNVYTENYEVTAQKGRLTINQRPILVQTRSLTWEYDGKVHFDGDGLAFEDQVLSRAYEYGNADLLVGDVLDSGKIFEYLVNGEYMKIARASHFGPNVSRATGANVVQFIVMRKNADSSEKEITNNYYICSNIVKYNGDLEIIRRNITVAPKSVEKNYDGTPLSVNRNEFVLLDDTTLAEGDVLTVTADGKNTLEGVGELTFTYTLDQIKIVNKAGEDVTNCYHITLEEGTLKVNAALVTVIARSAGKYYDGLPLVHNKYNIKGLPQGYTAKVWITGSQTEVGSSPNKVEHVQIFDANGKDVTDSAWITVVTQDGMLMVQTYVPSIGGGGGGSGGENLFDWIGDKPPSQGGGSGGSGGSGSGEGEGGSGEGEGGSGEGEGGSGEGEGGSGEGEGGSGEGEGGSGGSGSGGSGGSGGVSFEMTGDLSSKMNDSDGAGEGEIPTLFYVSAGTSGIIYIRQTSYGNYQLAAWSGAPYAYDDGSGISPLNYAGLAMMLSGAKGYDLKISSDYSDIAKYWLTYYVAQSNSTTSNDINATYQWVDEYSLTYYPGGYNPNTFVSLKGTQYEELELAYREFVYEYYTTLAPSTKAKMLEIAMKNGIMANMSRDEVVLRVQKLVSTYLPYSMDIDKEYTGDFAVFFFEEAEEAICQHYATAAAAMLRALGIPARYTGGFAVAAKANQTVPVTAMEAHAWVEVYVDGMGWVPLEVTGSSTDPQKLGKFTIKPTDILKFYPETKELYHDNVVEDIQGKKIFAELLAKNYTYQAIVTGSQIGVGESLATITKFILYDPNGNDVTELYDIKFEAGKLTLTDNYIIEIDLEEVTKTYDGTPLSYSADAYWSAYSKYLPNGATVEFDIASVAPLTAIGKVTDEELLRHVKVMLNGEDITKNCCFIFSEYRLEILQREIVVVSHSASKPYDGKPLENREVVIREGTLLEGHKLVAKAHGSIADEGEAKNYIGEVKIVDEQGNDVTKYYNITKVEGVLEVTGAEE